MQSPSPAMSRPAAVTRAREMFAAGWTPKQIHGYLHAQGVTVAYRTVHSWVNPDAYEKALARNRARKARQRAQDARFRAYGVTPEYRTELARRLRDSGVPVTSIAKTMTVLFEEPVSTHHVRLMVTGTVVRRPWERNREAVAA